MSLVVVGTVAFDAIETPFGKTDKIIGGAATYSGISASYFVKNIKLVSVVGEDFPTEMIQKFIVSRTTNRGRLFIRSITFFCNCGIRLLNIKNSQS